MTSKLEAIPVAVDGECAAAGAPGNALAILHEIEAMLASLAQRGQAGSIDLRRTPLCREDYAYLQDSLGRGEASAEVDALGVSHIQETAVPGVWWIKHRNTAGKVVGEFIEVARCPELLMTPEAALHDGQQLLRDRLRAPRTPLDPEDIARRLEAIGLDPGRRGLSEPTPNQPAKRGNDHAG